MTKKNEQKKPKQNTLKNEKNESITLYIVVKKLLHDSSPLGPRNYIASYHICNPIHVREK
jgi:hypothetical protein